MQIKKTFVLVVLFILPIVAYLFFASGVHNFGKLAILSTNVPELPPYKDIKLKDNITILGFLGNDLQHKKTNALNLNQKIYKPFYEFKDFQFVMLVPKGMEEQVMELKKELSALTDIRKWKFVFAEDDEIKTFFLGLNTNIELENDLSTPYVFIIDKDKNLRGRTDDEDEGTKYGFNAISVDEITNKMEDDVKIILAEYRLALKKNSADR